VKWQDCCGRARRSIRYGASPASALYLRDDRRSARGGISRENACPIPAGPAARLHPGTAILDSASDTPTRRRGPPLLGGLSPTSPATGPASASPSSAIADDSATSLPPATADAPRSCATRDQAAAGPSGRTWPAAASSPSPNCPPLSGRRPVSRTRSRCHLYSLRAFRNRLLTALIRRRRSRPRKCEHEVFPGQTEDVDFFGCRPAVVRCAIFRGDETRVPQFVVTRRRESWI
jgi:hypothetical protein